MPLRPCGIEQAKQAYLTEYQINIVSKEYENKIIYAGPEKDKKIYLYMHNNHYDVITKMPGFFARNYCCHACKKVYDHLENHVCPNECKCCGFFPICPEESWRSCRNCRRQFKSQRCYDQHKQSRGGARPICARLIKCTKCGQHVPRYKKVWDLWQVRANRRAPLLYSARNQKEEEKPRSRGRRNTRRRVRRGGLFRHGMSTGRARTRGRAGRRIHERTIVLRHRVPAREWESRT